MTGGIRAIALRALTVASAAVIAVAQTSSQWLVAAALVGAAAFMLSRDVRTVTLDYALLATVVGASHRWQFADQPPMESVTAAVSALAVVIALTGGQRHSLRSTGLALAAATVMLSSLVDPATLRWVGVGGALVALFSVRRRDNDAPGATVVSALSADITALVMSMGTITAMAAVGDLGTIVLIPFAVSLCSVVAIIVRWGRFSELLTAEMLRDSVPEASMPMIELRASGDIIRASASADLLGLVPESNVLVRLDEPSREIVDEAMRHPVVNADPMEVQVRLMTHEGGWRDLDIGLRYLGRVAETWVASVRDRTDDVLAHHQQEVELDRLRSAVTTDRLTGVLNRGGIFGLLESRLRTGGATVLFLDLDGFKSVNDTHGHEAGDAVLVAVAQRLDSGLGADWGVGRLGGDEFLVVGPDVPMEPGDLDRLAELVRAPVGFAGLSLVVDTSIGTAIGQMGADPDAVLRVADAAMYRHKGGRQSGQVREMTEDVPSVPAGPSGRSQIVERRRLSNLFSR